MDEQVRYANAPRDLKIRYERTELEQEGILFHWTALGPDLIKDSLLR